jgi:hypothetical protein
MNLPFFNKREALHVEFECQPEFRKSKHYTNGVDIDFRLVVRYSDGSKSQPLPGAVILSSHQVQQLGSLIAPPKTRKKRSQCKNGHPKDAENTILVSGKPTCRTCYLATNKRRNAERKALRKQAKPAKK